MSEAKHTPGPWQLEADPCHFDSLTTITAGQRMNAKPRAWPAYPLTVQVGGTATLMEQQANARRIVACVNACEGFSIEELEGADLFKDSIESGNLINELLAALEKIVEMNVQWALDQHGDATKAENMDCVRVARAAIAKATAQQ